MALEELENQDDRKILWIVDEKGGEGKTYFGKWLESQKNAFFIQNGKSQDIAQAYRKQKYVVMDYTRDYEDYINYSVLESFKNGRIFAPKYESKVIKMTPAKVICFSNWMPDQTKLSTDRWKIIEIPK